MVFRGLLGPQAGEVVLEYEGELPAAVYEAIEHYGGRIVSESPLVVRCQESVELVAALSGVLAVAKVPAHGLRMRRSVAELTGLQHIVA